MQSYSKAEIEQQLKQATDTPFYVYMLLRPDGHPFYVGKGKHRRLFAHEREALGQAKSHKLNTIRAIHRSGRLVAYHIVAFFADEQDCFAREKAEILGFGRHDLRTGILTNQTAGGEGIAGLSPETRQRLYQELHGLDAKGERQIANRFFAQLSQAISVPIRPAKMFRPQHILVHRQARSPTMQMAAALVASAILNRVLLEPDCLIPRSMSIESELFYLENGVCADLLKAGLATLIPSAVIGQELFLVNSSSLDTLLTLIDHRLLLDAGILMPS